MRLLRDDAFADRLVNNLKSEQVDCQAVQSIQACASGLAIVAGDAFAGALAVKWAESDDLNQAIMFACAAGAIAASRDGAQPSLPTRGEIDHFIFKASQKCSHDL